MKIHIPTLTAVMLVFTSFVFAHPTGNMITVGEHVLWSYITPINDPNHHACIMIWNKDSEPKIFIQSEFSASDYMLYNNQDIIYIVERKYSQVTQEFKIRVLKTTVETKPEVIWDWFKDDWRVGEGGFIMLSDNQMVFGKYPEIYKLKKGGKPTNYFDFEHPIKRIRAVENNRILLLDDGTCYLVQQNGTILKQWNNLIDKNLKNTPLNRNQIFDADYKNGMLLFAYWGKRTFELIDANGKQKILLRQTEPLVPHWVAFLGNEKLLFSSELHFNGKTPKPNLITVTSNGNNIRIW